MISCRVFINHLSVALVIILNALLIIAVQPELKLVNVVSIIIDIVVNFIII